jgi:fatty acid desaturase
MAEGNSSSSGGIGFVGLLTILFIALKLTGFITWSWIWVLSPIWIVLGLVLVILLGIAIIAFLKR